MYSVQKRKAGLFKKVISYLLGFITIAGVYCLVVEAKEAEEEGLVAYWSFDEGKGNIAHDGSGNGNDGEIYGAQWVEGKFGKALGFDGNSKVIVPHAESLNVGEEITIDLWIKLNEEPSKPWANILNKGTDSYRLLFRSKSRQPYFQIKKADGSTFNTTFTCPKEPVLKTGKWYHLIAIYDGEEVVLYIDGKKCSDSTLTPTWRLKTNKEALCMGGLRDAYLNGTIDEVKIYNKVREEDKIVLRKSRTSVGKEAVNLDKNTAYDKLPGTVVTPHIPWAKPYYRGKTKVLVIAPTWSHRETVELSQRLDITYSAIMTSRFSLMYKWPGNLNPDLYGPIVIKPETAGIIVQQKLKQDYDVIVIGKIHWKILSKQVRRQILKKIEDGTGLVYISPPPHCEELNKLFHKKVEDEHAFTTSGIPFKALPALNSLPLNKLISLSEFGKGRVAKVISRGTSPWLCLTPAGVEEDWSLFYDYYHSFLAKAVLWASQKEPAVYIKKVEVIKQSHAVDKLTVGLFATNEKTETVNIELVIRDKANVIEQIQNIPLRLEPGATETLFKLPHLKAGLHFVDIWVKKGQSVLNWGSTFIDVKTEYEIVNITLDKKGYKAGEAVRGKVVFNKPPSKRLKLRIQLWDNFDRLLDEKNIQVIGKETPFSFEIRQALSILLKLKASLFDQELILCEAAKEFPVDTRRKANEDFYFVMWSDSYPEDYLTDSLFRQYHKMGVDAIFETPGKRKTLPWTCWLWEVAHANLQIVPYHFQDLWWGKAQRYNDNIRRPCLNVDNLNVVFDKLKTNEEPLSIGGLRNSCYLNGAIDEVKIFNKVREENKIASSRQVSEEDLVAYWSFDEGKGDIAHDGSGNGNDGEIYGAQWVEGKFGKALEFDGNSKVIVPHAKSLNVGEEITIDLWIKLNEEPSKPWAGILAKGEAASFRNSPYNLLFYKKTRQPYFEIRKTDDSALATHTGKEPALESGKWYHLVAIYDGAEIILYIDGKKYGKKALIQKASNKVGEIKKKIKEAIPFYRDFGMHVHNLTIQGGLAGFSPKEFCFCPRCTKGFQEYLHKEYKTIEELNKEWESNYLSWEEIKPITLPEARKEDRYAQWADFRLYMEEVFTNLHTFCKKEIQEIDSGAIVGINEPLEATSYSGISWWKLLNAVDMCGLYMVRGMRHTDIPLEIVRSFMRKRREDTITGGWMGCYGHSEDFNRAVPWRILFHGGQSVWWWKGYERRGTGGWTALTPDLAPLPHFAQASEEIQEIKRGIGKLLLNSKRENDGIAVHYSPLSIHASTIEHNKTDIVESQRNFIYALEDIGLQYNFVSNEQIEKGNLEKEKYKVLVLPYAQALSSMEVKKIKEFVQNGGSLIADFTPGVMDKHCKRLSFSPLEKVFGNFKASLRVNNYGKGKTFYLDSLLKDYFILRRAGNESQPRDKLREILKSADVNPRLKITTSSGTNAGAIETVFFKDGTAEYVCLLKDRAYPRGYGAYLVKDKNSYARDLREKNVTITFPYNAHVYDVREGKYYGCLNRINTELSPMRAKVFALLPYKVNKVNLYPGKREYIGGDVLSYEVKIGASTDNFSTHGVRLELINPEGQIVNYYSRNLIAEAGICSGSIHLSLNEKKGEWQLKAKDIVSGKAVTEKFVVH